MIRLSLIALITFAWLGSATAATTLYDVDFDGDVVGDVPEPDTGAFPRTGPSAIRFGTPEIAPDPDGVGNVLVLESSGGSLSTEQVQFDLGAGFVRYRLDFDAVIESPTEVRSSIGFSAFFDTGNANSLRFQSDGIVRGYISHVDFPGRPRVVSSFEFGRRIRVGAEVDLPRSRIQFDLDGVTVLEGDIGNKAMAFGSFADQTKVRISVFGASDTRVRIDNVLITAEAVRASIDIHPDSDLNPVNPMSRGLVPVVLLGKRRFDVLHVDPATLVFGPSGVLHQDPATLAFTPSGATPSSRREPHFDDVNGDGRTDLVSYFVVREAGIAPGDTEACLMGAMLFWTRFEGCDSVQTRGRHRRR